jgi:hypothetical protein
LIFQTVAAARFASLKGEKARRIQRARAQCTMFFTLNTRVTRLRRAMAAVADDAMMEAAEGEVITTMRKPDFGRIEPDHTLSHRLSLRRLPNVARLSCPCYIIIASQQSAGLEQLIIPIESAKWGKIIRA